MIMIMIIIVIIIFGSYLFFSQGRGNRILGDHSFTSGCMGRNQHRLLKFNAIHFERKKKERKRRKRERREVRRGKRGKRGKEEEEGG